MENNPVNWIDPSGLDATSWGGDGRSIGDGPKNGNWGGGNWSGGWNPNKHGGIDGPAAPMDSGDESYMYHDICYGKATSDCEKKACDKKLISSLRNLPLNPKKWAHPPKPGTEFDSAKFARDAMEYFNRRQ